MTSAAALYARHRDRIPVAAILVGVTFWGCGPLFVRAVDAPSLTIVFWRLWVGVPVALLLARVARSPVNLTILRRSFVPGLLFAASLGTAFASFQLTSVANATLIPALQPALVLLVAGRWFGEVVGRREIVLAGVGLAGVTLVVVGAGSGGGATLQGDALAAANLVFFTAYYLAIKHERELGVPAASILAGVIVVSALAMTPVALLFSPDIGAISGTDWGWILAMVLVPGTIGHGLMNWAQRFVDVSKSSLLGLLSPVVSAVGAWLVYSQPLTVMQIAGGLLVLAGTAGIVAGRRTPALDQAVTEL